MTRKETLQLTPQDEEELWQAMEEIRRGEYVDGAELLDEIRPLSKLPTPRRPEPT